MTSSPGLISDKQRDEHRLGAAAGDGDLGLGVDRQAQVPGGVLGDRLAEVLRPPGDRILVDVGLDRAAGGRLELGRGGEVGHSLRQVDRVVLRGLDRHAADHALGEPRGLVREQGRVHQDEASTIDPIGRRAGGRARRTATIVTKDGILRKGNTSVARPTARGIRRDHSIRHHTRRVQRAGIGADVWEAKSPAACR